MRSVVSAAIGGVMGFSAALLMVLAAVLLAAGVGGGILVRERPGTGRVLNYDPSDVVLRAAAVGGAALILVIGFAVIAVSLGRRERRRTASR